MTKVELTLIFFNKDFTRFWYVILIFLKLLDYPNKPNSSVHFMTLQHFNNAP